MYTVTSCKPFVQNQFSDSEDQNGQEFYFLFFITVHECNRQTDGRTDVNFRIILIAITTRAGKNDVEMIYGEGDFVVDTVAVDVRAINVTALNVGPSNEH